MYLYLVEDEVVVDITTCVTWVPFTWTGNRPIDKLMLGGSDFRPKTAGPWVP
eukprot:SAG22_NODE_192_length_15668_cov_4.492389_4_plen_52_part_00